MTANWTTPDGEPPNVRLAADDHARRVAELFAAVRPAPARLTRAERAFLRSCNILPPETWT